MRTANIESRTCVRIKLREGSGLHGLLFREVSLYMRMYVHTRDGQDWF